MAFRRVPRHGLPVKTSKDIQGSALRMHADVVIVGSGAGGAVAAYELARTGKSVVVLEKGRYIPSANFTEKLGDAMKYLYADQGAQPSTLGDCVVIQGSCVGGSTVVNATIAFRPPEFKLNEWANEHGIEGVRPQVFNHYLDKISDNLSVHENEPHEINTCSHKVIEGCERLGIEWKPVSRNVKQCALTGHCLSGCPSDRKMSMLVSYLPWAIAHGAQVFSDAEVIRVRHQNGRATGVEGVIRDPDTGRKVADVRIDAQVVILSAGATWTPCILQRSEFPSLSPFTGRNFSAHPFVTVLGRFPEEVYGWRGALTGVHVDEFLESDGMLFESGLAEPEQLLAQGEHGTGEQHLAFMKEYKYFSAVNCFVHDEGHGRIRWVGDAETGRRKIEWQLSEKDINNLKKATSIAARIYFAAGAQKVYLPTFKPLIAHSVFELDEKLDQIQYENLGLFTFRAVTVHPQGTARMGTDPLTSVVDPYGESHDIKGLFVSDTSLFPTELTVNPQLTTYALANYIADNINRRERDYFV